MIPLPLDGGVLLFETEPPEGPGQPPSGPRPVAWRGRPRVRVTYSKTLNDLSLQRITMTKKPGILLAGLLIALHAAAALGAPPATRKEPVTDRYHGVEIVDEYRWLENWDDPEVKAWSEAQNAYARSVLDGLPGVDTIRKQVTAIRKIEVPHYGTLKSVGGQALCPEDGAPEAAALPRRHVLGRRSRIGARGGRPGEDRLEGRDVHGLVHAFAGRRAGGGVAVPGRLRAGGRARLPDRYRCGGRRGHPSRQLRHGRRRPVLGPQG